MATKKLSSVIPDVAPVAPAADQPLIKALAIDEMSLLRLGRAADKERAARMELMVASASLNGMFQKWLSENEEASKVNVRIQELQKEQKKAQDDYTAVIEKVSKELQIDMKEYAYDDETGVLQRLPTSQSENTH